MVKIGARAHDYGKDEPESLFARIRADGFSCVQLALKKALAGVGDVTPALLERVNAALKKNDLSVAVLGAYVDLALADGPARLAAAEEFRANIPFARELGAACVGTETTPTEKQPGLTRKEAMRLLLGSLESILPTAEQNGVTVAVEPVFSHTLNTPELARRMLGDLRSPNLKIIFDPVNLLSEDAVPTQRDLWERCFECFGGKIVAVHLKGARIGSDGRLTACGLTESVVDYGFIVSRLKQLPQDFNILREEVVPANAAEDLEFIRDLTGLPA